MVDCSTQIYFEVEDSGVGIPLEQQARIFKPFHQVGDEQMRHQGTGLGLAISQQLVQMMGGELCVESGKTAVGSRFWFEIPLLLIVGSNHTELTTTRYESGYTRTTGDDPFKILLVDDLAQNRMVLAVFLASLGFTVVEADNGLDAIAQTEQSKPDLIFMDLVMPKMNGLNATRRIRQLPNCRQLPIIALSANLNAGTQRESLAAGCNDFLPKPFETMAILEKLQQYLPLEWIYEAIDRIAQLDYVIPREPKEIILPSQRTLTDLFHLSEHGDIGGLRKYMAALVEEDTQYIPFTVDLGRVVDGFITNEVRQYLRDCLAAQIA